MLGSCRGLIRLKRVPPSCRLCLCCWSKRTSGGTEELPPETHEFTHTHTHTRTQDTLQYMHYTLFEGWVLVMQIPLGEKWSQSESRWEVRPGVQALHLSSVIKTGTLGCSHPIEEKSWRGKESEGVQTEACSRSAERAAERDSHQPRVPFILISEMHSHLFLSRAPPPPSPEIRNTYVPESHIWYTLGYVLAPTSLERTKGLYNHLSMTTDFFWMLAEQLEFSHTFKTISCGI